MSQDPLEYLVYLRRSNGRKAVPRQRAITRKYIADKGGMVLDEFADADRTAFRKIDGAQPQRDEFARMLAVLRSRKGLRVAAWHADRLTRNDTDTAELIRVCAAGAHLIETPRGGIYDMANANGRKRFRDDASDAIYEVDHLQERVLAGRDDVAAEGRWLGGKRPFGWELDEHPAGDDGKPVLDEDGKPVNGILRLVDAEAAAIRAACEAVLAKVSLGAIAQQWNAAGLTGTLGSRWSRREVRRVLLRPRNAGLMEHRGIITGKASWPEIVDEPTWRAVRAVLLDDTRRTTPGPERQHLLSGLATCSACGRGLVAGQVSGKGRTPRLVYRCRIAGKDSAHVARDAAALDTYIVMLVIERLSRPDALNLLRKDTAVDLAALGREKAAIEGAMRESNDLRKSGMLTAAEFTEERTGHLARLETIADRTAAAARADVLMPMIVRFRDDPAAKDHQGRVVIWESYPLGVRRAVIDTLMSVKIFPQPKGRPKGWVPGAPYFDPAVIDRGIEWRR